MDSDGLSELTARARRDIDIVTHPRLRWLEPRRLAGGTPVLDVLIVGAGQGGVVLACQLRRDLVDNVRVIDLAPRGQEGPWVTYGRMPTLRSPKEYPGPDLGIPSLAYRSWHEAKYGTESWDRLSLIATHDWNDYLLWVRDTVGIPVENETRLTGIETGPGNTLRASLERADGSTEIAHARKIVLATGHDGTGRWWMPDFLEALPRALRAHTADTIDFAGLAGKTVAVVGSGASAFDNAAMALEHGAAAVHLISRRRQLQVVQPYRYITFAGFLRHMGDMEDAWRWRFMRHVLGLREGVPQATYDRAKAFDNFRIHRGAAATGAQTVHTPDGETQVALRLGEQTLMADFVIAGTGMDVDFTKRREFAGFAAEIRTWADQYTPPPDERNDRLARYPYLDPDFGFMQKRPGAAAFLRDIHCFGIGATMSFGPSGASINAMHYAVPRLAAGITRALFREELPRHWEGLRNYADPQTIVRPEDAAD